MNDPLVFELGSINDPEIRREVCYDAMYWKPIENPPIIQIEFPLVRSKRFSKLLKPRISKKTFDWRIPFVLKSH